MCVMDNGGGGAVGETRKCFVFRKNTSSSKLKRKYGKMLSFSEYKYTYSHAERYTVLYQNPCQYIVQCDEASLLSFH